MSSKNKRRNPSSNIESSAVRSQRLVREASVRMGNKPETNSDNKRKEIETNVAPMKESVLVAGESTTLKGFELKEHPSSETERDYVKIENNNKGLIAKEFARKFAAGIPDPEIDRLAMETLSYDELLAATEEGFAGLIDGMRADSFGKER